MAKTTFRQRVGEATKRILEDALLEHHGNRTHTAAALGMERTYLLRLIKEYDIKIESSYVNVPPQILKRRGEEA
jgi:DNA-binding NtrC family response regulator